MAITEHQGHLQALEKMNRVELQDLLNRQNKILANKKFLRTLPDKGKKIETFADRLKQAIREKEDVEKTAQLFEKMDLGASCMAEGVIERIPDVSTNPKDQTQPDNVTKSHSTVEHSKKIPNVFLKTETTVKQKQKFFPYKSLKSTTIPEGLKRPDVPRGKVSPARTLDAASRPPEFSAVVVPLLRHPGTKSVELEESTHLLEEQKKKVDELLAQQSAEKLAERLHIKLGQYTPASTDMRYRDQDDEEEDGDDTGDEEEEEDADDVEND